MGKKILIGFIVVLLVFTIIYFMLFSGIIKLPTVQNQEEEVEILVSAEDLQNERFYVWHDTLNTLEHDLEGTSDIDVFNLCPEGTVNWKKNKSINHTIWFSTDEDDQIPTLYPGDGLVFISDRTVPNEGIAWERYADYGYCFGVANMVVDKSNHYRIVYNSDDAYEGFINPKSDAKEISDYFKNIDVFLDSVGGVSTKDGLISPGGSVLGLDKGAEYWCKWYKGSLRQDFQMTADQHTFCILESFSTYDFDFVDNKNNDLSNIHSCIRITLPEWLKTGYYYIEGKGFFRYVGMEELAQYNGSAYDPNVDWNDPIILYDEHHMCIYDPSQGLDKRDEIGSQDSVTVSNDKTMLEKTTEFPIVTDPELNPSDEGAEEYEEFDDMPPLKDIENIDSSEISDQDT